MIDPEMFDRDKLVAALTRTMSGNINQWLSLCEIVPDYMPPFPRVGDRPKIIARCLVDAEQPAPGPGIVTSRYSYLRVERGLQIFWDGYGTEFHSVEVALLALVRAPVPPALLKPIAWAGVER